MSTGKSYEEIMRPSVQCNAGKWTGTRVFRVETSSPSIAILTIQEDAGIPCGTEWDEGCDSDFENGSTSSIKMRSKTYDTSVINSNNVTVTVSYEDSRYNTEFDETVAGFVRRYFKYGSQTEQVFQSAHPVLAWDSTHVTNETAFEPTITITGTSLIAPDRNVGFDGETVNGAQIETPNLIYGEVWRLSSTAVGSYGSSIYYPGIDEVINFSTRFTDPDDEIILANRTGYGIASSANLNITYLQALFGFTGTINAEEFRSFPAGSLLMLPPQVQQVGLTAYILNFEWSYTPPYFYNLNYKPSTDPDIYVGNTKLQTLEKAGWNYLWYKYAVGSDKQQINEIRVAQVYPALSFSALGLGS